MFQPSCKKTEEEREDKNCYNIQSFKCLLKFWTMFFK